MRGFSRGAQPNLGVVMGLVRLGVGGWMLGGRVLEEALREGRSRRDEKRICMRMENRILGGCIDGRKWKGMNVPCTAHQRIFGLQWWAVGQRIL